MKPLERFSRLSARVKGFQRTMDRAAAQRDVKLEELKSRFGLKTLKAAKAKAKELKQRRLELANQLEEGLGEFEEQWSAKLEESEDEH